MCRFILFYFLLTQPFSSLLFWAANGQLQSGYVYNWTSWIDDYGFGKCTDIKKCNVFPDGKPFPQSNDWRRKSYVYVWHTMGENNTSLQIFMCPHTNSLTVFLSVRLLWLFQVSIMRRVTVPPPVWPSTPPTSRWAPRSWRSWSTGSVSAGSTAPSPRTTVSSTSQVESNSPAYTTLSVSMFQPDRQHKPRESIIYNSPSHSLSLR